jgi:hypothetical protein
LAVKASDQMKTAVIELVGVVESVPAVVKENTAATEEMSVSSHEVTRAIENIASVSEENSAAVEEVSASAEEMSAQVEEVSASASSLEEMAQALQDAGALFKFSNENRQTSAQTGKLTPRQSTNVTPSNGNGENGRHTTEQPSRLLQIA